MTHIIRLTRAHLDQAAAFAEAWKRPGHTVDQAWSCNCPISIAVEAHTNRKFSFNGASGCFLDDRSAQWNLSPNASALARKFDTDVPASDLPEITFVMSDELSTRPTDPYEP